MIFAALLKATIALVAALGVALMARRASASTRHAVLVAGQLAALTMPLLVDVVPPVEVAWVKPLSTNAIASPSPPASRETIAAPMPIHAPRVNVLPLIWIIGFAIVAATRARSFVRALRIASRAGHWNDVFLSDEIDQPVTVGSRILLPSVAPQWDAMHRAAVLLHERSHVERRDSLLGLISDAACAVYWFHPLAWIAARRARLERERACDEAVLTAGIGRTDYAQTLLTAARGMSRVAGMAMAERSQLETRILAILDAQVRQPRRGVRALVVMIAIATAPFVAALAPLSIIRPTLGEPDLLGDEFAPPSSEWIGAPMVDVAATGVDAALIAKMQRSAAQSPRASDDLVPDRARWALGRVRDGRLIEPLLASLQDDDWRVRAYAAWALGVARDRRATKTLVALLDDPIWRMRAMAAFALAETADPAARPAMQRALGDRAWQVRVEAVDYFATSHDPADRRLLEAMLSDRHMAVRAEAEQALGRS